MVNSKRTIVLIAHNIRSCHNVGSLLRTADGLGVAKVFLTGYTPYPIRDSDNRLPHIAAKIHKQIQKTALGAEITVAWEHKPDVEEVIKDLKAGGFMVSALEQSPSALSLPDFAPPAKIALLVGSEVNGVEPAVLALRSPHLEIPMLGAKESFNVVQAAAMALYHCRFFS